MSARGTSGFGRRRRWALAVALLLLAALLALWLVRKPIATRFVDRTLAAAKVPARYTVADLGFGAQRLTNVVIGDPAAPDLVADWIETRTRITSHGPELTGVRAGRLRLRGRLIDGRLSLGSIDRLLPKGDGSPFALPPLDLQVEDGRMRLETPYGVAGVSLKGSGRLDGGFDGRLAVVGERLGTANCAGERVAAALRVRSLGRDAQGHGRAELSGPLNLSEATCGGVRLAALRSDLASTLVLGAERGSSLRATFSTSAVVHAMARTEGVSGTVALAGGTGYAQGTLDAVAKTVATEQGRAASLAVRGPLAIDRAGVSLGEGQPATATLTGARVSPALLRRTEALASAGSGTPLEPLLARAGQAARSAGSLFDLTATFGAIVNAGDGGVSLKSAALRSASGAALDWSGEAGIEWGRQTSTSLAGRLAARGGGLPTLVAQVSGEPGPGRRIAVVMQPYEAGGARLALTPVTIAGDRIVTRATLSGPLSGGRVDGLTVPLDLRFAGGAIVANPACTPLGFDRLAISGLTLRPARLQLCPTGPALVRVANGTVTGGARLSATRLAGTLGSTPVAAALTGATLTLADRGFALEGVETRLGSPERVTRLDFARLSGRAGRDGITGTFAGGSGQIANVPLLLADAAGDWRFAGGALRLTGALGVSDAQAGSPRFQPMQAREVALALVDNAITATGALHEPTTGTRVAGLTIRHALASGTGQADLAVPDLTFAKGFQPELLTRLTFGVIADVAGTVSGEARIAWNPDGVTSTGTFRTAGTDLAAAFGPVTGIVTEIRFTDLLALESAPGQVARIASINPGIAVTDGTIRYQTLPDTRIRVEGGEWPFAGGHMTLDPTTLDFGQQVQRRMTFRVDGVAADRFLQQFDFKNLDATGTFDGVLPMVFDDAGGRIEDGHMTVREGGGTIAYVGDLTEKDLGFWGNLAFQALKSLRYRSLQLTMNGPLAGEMVTDVRFAGVSQGEGAQRGGIAGLLVGRLQRLPFVFNVRIKAPFRGLIDSAQSFYEPRRLIQRNLPALIQQQNSSVQPPASGPVPDKD